jgi:F0F1-type ATP synthase membrane subunit b/b'
MLFSFDGTLLVQILNFVTFWVLLNYLFIKPTRRAIEARLRFIATQQAEAAAFEAKAKELHAQADAILDEARRMVDESMRTAGARASDETHAIERMALDESATTVALAHGTVESERAQAAAKQGPFVDELARTMAERALSFERVA